MIVEGVHTLPEQDLADVAWKLVAVNLSDLAAKGAEPLGVLLGYMLGKGNDRFIEGLQAVLAEYDVPLLGGDTVSGTGPRSFGLTAIGRASHCPVPSRSGARPGDAVYITGPVGAAMKGYEILRSWAEGDSAAYRRPVPLLAEGRALAPYVSAMMDVSDGVLLDAWRLASASGVTLVIESAVIPIGVPENRRADALRWGEDYQLLFTAPVDRELPIKAFRIGLVEQRTEAPLTVDGIALADQTGLGYEHQ